jgi:hypothetical protein|tara:strand:- start:649 stop:1311 length:663 start_codon:yes stop_codon:yes gene_type:complete
MQCSQAQDKLKSVLQSDAISSEEQELQRHLQHCELCQQYCSDQILHKKLSSLNAPEPRAGFADRSIARAIEQHNSSTTPLLPANIWVMAAVLVLGVMLGVFFTNNFSLDGVSPAAQPIALMVNQVKPVNIVIDSDTYSQTSTITLLLADNIAIEGYPDTNELSWKTELHKGKNLLILPLILKNRSPGYMEISYTSGDRTHRVRVQVSAKQLTQPKVSSNA